MEFHDVGEQCALPLCKQLDFLPFSCSHCGLIFCKDHYLPDNHKCVAAPLKSDASQATQLTVSYYKCSNKNCSETSAVPLLCPVCQIHFCLSHRHHGCLDKPPTEEEIRRWNSPREQFRVAKNEVDHQVSSKLNEKIGKKGNVTAMKVQLMRLKGRAKGPSSIPSEERSYFLVHCPLQCSLQIIAAFVGRNWTVGRVIDSLAETCKVPNRNNEATASKLRLFDYVNGKMLGPINNTLQNLFEEGSMCDGMSVILEYMPGDNVENDCLINTNLYKE